MAYFTSQVFKKENPTHAIFENTHGQNKIANDYCMSKFLESFYYCNNANQIIYFYLVSLTNKNDKVVLSTTCDYDELSNFVVKFDNNNYHELPEGMFEFLKQQYKATVKSQQHFEQQMKDFYIICDETKSYIALSEMNEFDKQAESKNQMLVCPLALLTRYSTKRQGGGDLPDEYFENKHIASWFGKEIYADTKVPQGYKNISSEICII